MLTRLHIKGFKNLLDCEVAFGPFTCVAGTNATGKSNLFDAIMFLRDLTEYPIIEAASRVRDPSGRRRGDLRSLFTSIPNGDTPEIDIKAEFLVPKVVKDDFGREAHPSATHLAYQIILKYISPTGTSPERLELTHESLTYVPKGESRKRLGFRNSFEFWASVIGKSRRADFISTETNESNQPIIRLRQDGGNQGRPLDVLASNSPRTILGTINTDDKPTALAARREMQSWRFLQLEPSKLRLPDDFADESSVSAEGAHLPGTLARIEKHSEVANRLSNLLPDIKSVDVDIDEGRRLKTLVVTQRDGTKHSARSLSDGTLRFLALAIIGADSLTGGLVCLEEPENGIHPSRVHAMMELLTDIAVDPAYATGEDNPLRQVIINTHSPIVVQQLSTEDLLVSVPFRTGGITATVFAPINGTWRTSDTKSAMATVPLGTLISYLNEPPPDSNPDPMEEKESLSVGDFVRGQLKLFE